MTEKKDRTTYRVANRLYEIARGGDGLIYVAHPGPELAVERFYERETGVPFEFGKCETRLCEAGEVVEIGDADTGAIHSKTAAEWADSYDEPDVLAEHD